MKINRFIVVDDDPENNSICRMIIKKQYHEAEIKTFLEPEKGFEFIASLYPEEGNPDNTVDVILLDINMPTWTGWDFLDHFEKLPERIKKQINVFILSSSVDHRDIERAKNNKHVKDYIIKPINKELLTRSIEKLEAGQK